MIQARLTSNIPSAAGREDTIPVRLAERDGMLAAEPIFGKSNLIYTLVNCRWSGAGAAQQQRPQSRVGCRSDVI